MMTLPSWLPLAALLVNGLPASIAFTDRILEISITDGIGFENDCLEITLDDRNYLLPLLNPGDKVIPVLAYLPTGGMADLGTYTVESARYNMRPRTWTIKAQAADFINTQIGQERTVTYHKKSLKEIADEVAGRHGLSAIVDNEFANKIIGHFNQQSQSDLDVLGELARKFGAIVSIKNDEIIIKKPFNGKNIAGEKLGAIAIDYKQISSGSFSQSKRDDTEGVTASYVDSDKAKRIKVTAGNAGNSREIKEIFNNEEQAALAAQAALYRAQSFKRALNFETEFNSQLSAEMPINFNHPRSEISGMWVIENRTHNFDRSGCTTSCDCLAPNDYADSLIEKHGITKDDKKAASNVVQKQQNNNASDKPDSSIDFDNGYEYTTL